MMNTRILTFILCVLAGIFSCRAEQWLETYKGTVGPYQVTARFNVSEEYSMAAGGSEIFYDGKYTYTKAGNSLNLVGYANGQTNWKVYLEETTPKGKKSAEWKLEKLDGGDLKGTMRVLKTNKTYKVYLRRTNR